MSGDPMLMLMHQWIEEHLIELEKLFPKNYELTFIARNTDQSDADIILTKDKKELVVEAIDRTWDKINQGEWQG